MLYWETYLREMSNARVEGYRCAIDALPKSEESAKRILIDRLDEMFSSFPKIPFEDLVSVVCEPRDGMFNVRITKSELAVLKQRASALGLSPTEYALQRLIYDPWVPPFTEGKKRSSVVKTKPV